MSAKAGRSLLFVGNFLALETGTRAVSEDLSLQLEARGWRVFRTSEKSHKVFRLIDMLKMTWSKRKLYDTAVIDVYSGPAFFFAEAVCWLLRRLNKPYVLTLHGGNLPLFGARCPERLIRLLGSAITVTTPSRYLQEQMGLYRENLRLIPNPVSLANYSNTLRMQAQPKLVWLRAFHQIYNPLLALSAVALLRKDFPDISLTMIGPDKRDGTLASVKAEIDRLHLRANVRLIGAIPKSQVPAYLSESDIFLNTTDVDNTPVSVLEGMACGLCIVSTNVGGMPYMIDNERDGLLVAPRDPAAFAEAIRRILTDPALAQRLSRSARRKVESFDWSRVLPEWEDLLTRPNSKIQSELIEA